MSLKGLIALVRTQEHKQQVLLGGLLSLAFLLIATAVLAWTQPQAAQIARLATTAADSSPRSVSLGAALADGMTTGAWLPYWDNGSGLDSVRNHGSLLNTLNVFGYETRSATDIRMQIKNAGAVRAAAQQAHLKQVATITESLDSADFRAFLTNNDTREAHVSALCQLAITNNYDGLDLDYETFALSESPDDLVFMATQYPAFVGEVASCLHVHNKTLAVTVISRSDDRLFSTVAPTVAFAAYDYTALGRVADYLQVMAYDYNYPGSSAGPVAPVDWVDRVATYAAAHVPPRKLVLGVPLYGYDWVTNTKVATTLSAAQAPKLISKYGVAPRRGPVSGSLTFQYLKNGVSHTVWYDDSRATEFHIGVAEKYHLRGVGLWALGDEDTSLWH